MLPAEEENLAIVKPTQKALSKVESREICIVRVLRKKDEVVVRLLSSKNSTGNHTICPRCGREAILLRTLNRYYCFYCKRYI